MEGAIELDPYELMALESVLTPSEVSADVQKSSREAIASKDLCLKIGSALIQARERGGEVAIVLTEPECWVLRERTSIFMSIGQRHDVGMSIKLKLYRLLLEYAFAHEVGDLDIADHEERSAREVRDALAAGDRNPNKDKTDRRSGH